MSYLVFKCESGSSHFQLGEGPGRGLLRDYECCVCQYFGAVEVRIRDVYIWPRDPGHLRLSSLVTAAQAGESWKTILVSIPSALSLGDTDTTP